MQPQQSVASGQQNPYMQSRVQYFAGWTAFSGSNLGLLEWSADNHIRLFAIDPDTGGSTGLIFDCLPSQIRTARATVAGLTLYTDTGSYNLDFSTGAAAWLLTVGLLGLLMAQRKQRQSGVQWWVDSLRAQGVVCYQNQAIGKGFKIFLLVMAGFMLLVFLLAVLA